MPIVATDSYRLSHLVKAEVLPETAFTREVVTFNGAAASLKIGTVLGVVSATGKYKVCVQSAADGSQNPAALLLEDKTVAATTDTKVLVMHRGPSSVSKAALVLDASFDNDTKKAAAYAALEAKNIQVLEAA